MAICLYARCLLRSAAASVLLAGLLSAQPVPADPREAAVGPRISSQLPKELPEDPDVRQWEKRAAEALQTRNWKWAADCLQHLIEVGGRALVQPPSGPFISARWHAQHILAGLPAEGRAVYRLVYDGEAAALFEQALADHDASKLRELLNRYYLTSWGDDAADRLAAWLIDAGQGEEAGNWLETLAWYPDSQVAPWSRLSKLAMACGQAGWNQRAGQVLSQLETLTEQYPEHQSALEVLRAYLEPMLGAEPRPSEESFSGLSGSGRPWGWMPAVQPALLEGLPWPTHPLPGLQGQASRPTKGQPTDQRWPVANLAADDRHLACRGPEGLLILDVDSFLSAVSPRPLTFQWPSLPSRWSRQGAGNPAEAVAYEDELSGVVGLAGELAFILERYAVSDYEPFRGQDRVAAPPAAGGNLRWGGPGVRRPQIEYVGGVALSAYRLADGKLAWRRGRSRCPDDPLVGAAFVGVPLEIGNSLVCPYREDKSLLLAVLDRQGRLLQRVPLCEAAPAEQEHPLRALWLAADDCCCYVATGHGYVFAVQQEDWSIRWAAKCPVGGAPPADQPTGGGPRPQTHPPHIWQSSPPILVEHLLIVAPSYSRDLVALERRTGRQTWRTSLPEGLSYIIGTNGQVLYVGGSRLVAIDVLTGRTLASTQVPAPTGRAALSGQRILAATARGLAVLQADTLWLEEILPLPGHQPLGNLICWRDAVFSIGPYAVAKYPDLQRSYEQALADLQRDPNDVRTRLRLAELELARNQPQEALKVLDRGHYALPDHLQRASRAKVRALLALADSADTPPVAEQMLLEQAWQAARDSADLLRAGMARAQHFESLGRHLEAARQYVRTLTRVGDEPLELDEHWRRQARAVLADRVRQLQPRLTEEQLASLQGQLHLILEQAISSFEQDADRRTTRGRRWLRQVIRLAESELDADPCNQADLWLARQFLSAPGREQFALAEFHLRRVLRRDGNPASRAEALTRLARMYMQFADGLPPMPLAAARCLEQIAALGEQTLAGDWTGLAGPSSAQQWAGRMLATLPPDELAAARAAAEIPTLPQNLEPAWTTVSLEGGALRPVHFAALPEGLAETLLCLTESEVIGYRLSDGRPAGWQAEFDLPEPGADSTFDQDKEGSSGVGVRQAQAVAEGQVLLLAASSSIHAFELASGRALWRVSASGLQAGSNLATSIQAGFVACLLSPNCLAVYPAAMLLPERGQPQPIWQRELSSDSLRWVRIADQRVAVYDAQAETVMLYELGSGAHVADLPVRQSAGLSVDVVFFEGVLCGADEGAVVAYRLADGQEVWRRAAPGRLTSLFHADRQRRLLGVGTETGHLLLFDPNSGEVRLTARADRTRRVHDAIVEGERITMLCEQPAKRNQERKILLIGLDADDGHQRWRSAPLAVQDYAFSPELLRQSTNLVVLLARDADERRSRLLCVNKQDGSVYEQPVLVPDEGTAARRRLRADLWVTPNRVILSLDDGSGGDRLVAFGPPDQEPGK